MLVWWNVFLCACQKTSGASHQAHPWWHIWVAGQNWVRSDSPQGQPGTAHVEFLILAPWPHKLVQDERLGTFTGPHQYELIFSCILLQPLCAAEKLLFPWLANPTGGVSSRDSCPLLSFCGTFVYSSCHLVLCCPLRVVRRWCCWVLLFLAAAACVHARVHMAACVSLLCCSSSPLHQTQSKRAVGSETQVCTLQASLFSWKNYSHDVLSSNLRFAEMLPWPEHHEGQLLLLVSHGDDVSSRFIKK